MAFSIVPPPNVKQILFQLRIGGPAKTWIWTQECKSFSLFPSAERRIKGKTSSWKQNTFIHIGKCICQNCQIVFEPKSEQVFLCSWVEDKRLEIKRIYPYWQMNLIKVPNVFVQISNCIWPNCQNYLNPRVEKFLFVPQRRIKGKISSWKLNVSLIKIKGLTLKWVLCKLNADGWNWNQD